MKFAGEGVEWQLQTACASMRDHTLAARSAEASRTSIMVQTGPHRLVRQLALTTGMVLTPQDRRVR